MPGGDIKFIFFVCKQQEGVFTEQTDQIPALQTKTEADRVLGFGQSNCI